MEFFDVSTPAKWADYKQHTNAIREWIGSDVLYERYMDGLIDIDEDGNVFDARS